MGAPKLAELENLVYEIRFVRHFSSFLLVALSLIEDKISYYGRDFAPLSDLIFGRYITLANKIIVEPARVEKVFSFIQDQPLLFSLSA